MTDKMSFIDAALTEISESKSNFAPYAKVIQAQNHPHPANRIAIAAVKLADARREARRVGNEVNMHPENIATWGVQDVANKVAWMSKSYANGRINMDMEDTLNGIDFTDDITEQLNIEKLHRDNVDKVVDDDIYTLNSVQSFLLSTMNYITEVEPVCYFQERTFDEETLEWKGTARAESYQEAEMLMEAARERMNEAEQARSMEQAQTLQFDAPAQAESSSPPLSSTQPDPEALEATLQEQAAETA